jgi:multisubunit Na+/H+ antiporter MnhB subunit
MTAVTLMNAGFAVLILGLAAWTIFVRDTFAAAAGFVAYGLLLGLVWVQLHGIDVALTEAAIGGGLTGAMLVRAATRLRPSEAAAEAERPGPLTRALAAAGATLVAVALAACVLAWPVPPPSLAAEALEPIASLGVGNPVTAVLLAYRALDTLLEATVLLIALFAVWSLAPDDAWGGRPGTQPRGNPEGLLAYLARLLPPIGIIVAIHIFWIGADDPGGKFQGATILAAMWLLAIMAGLADFPPVSSGRLRAALVVGPLAFMGIGFTGAWTAGAFLAYPDDWSKPLIIVIEAALMPTLALALALLIAGAPARKP